MAKRCNHYDVAFECLLRQIRRPFVSVNEVRRAPFHDTTLKSMDFIVYSKRSDNLLIDVKGRRLRTGSASLENWTSREDVTSLMHWEGVFGDGFRGMFVFAYELPDLRSAASHTLVWEFRGRRYAFYGVWAQDYAEMMRIRSPSWQTVCVPRRDFRRVLHPLLDVL